MQILDPSGQLPPCPAGFNLAAYVLAHAATQPDKTALEILGAEPPRRWSYAALESAVLGTAAGLREAGLKTGDRVLLRLGNTEDFPIAFLACAAADLVPVAISAALTAPEVAEVTEQVTPALCIADPELPMISYAAAPLLTLAELRELRATPPVSPRLADPERPGYIVFTSGNSGRPRPVLHAHRAVWARRMMWNGWYGLRPDDRVLHAGAFNWTYTLGAGLLDPWAIGATAVIPANGTRPADLPPLLQASEATIMAATPGVYRQMLTHNPHLDLPRLRHALSAGEAMPERVRASWIKATGRPVHEALGMSECSTFVSGAPARPAPAGTLGYPQPGRRLAVLDDTGQPRDGATTGILAIHRSDPGLMLGYPGAEDETRARYAGDWFLTGDMVERREDGALAYLGRGDDMMNAGGFRVSPLEVERAFSALPGVTEAAAVELRVKADATVIALFYAGAKHEDESLERQARETLARYKRPRLYIWKEALPKGGNGKLNRKALRRAWEEAHAQA